MKDKCTQPKDKTKWKDNPQTAWSADIMWRQELSFQEETHDSINAMKAPWVKTKTDIDSLCVEKIKKMVVSILMRLVETSYYGMKQSS